MMFIPLTPLGPLAISLVSLAYNGSLWQPKRSRVQTLFWSLINVRDLEKYRCGMWPKVEDWVRIIGEYLVCSL